MKRFILAAAFYSSLVLAGPPTHEFKGFYPGMSFESAQANPEIKLRCSDISDDQAAANKLCTDSGQSITIVGFPATHFMVSFLDDQLGLITVDFDTAHFDSVKAAIIKKYGKGISRLSSTVQNKLGGTFDNEIVMWIGRDDLMSLTQRKNTIDNAELLIISNKTLLEGDRRAHKNDGDL